ncbi:uncharacterized protein si:ch73-90k17.1 [Labeo rohita]|uniref:uncharacterized protein si:ch73-90k17.1 n=1 Tax=Labeo rohita TaxID=84645 RepID=UPI0021E2A5AB|nr:uncharacterized protein si:ch73-90k17.1 [Labeo rohita]
MELTVVGDGTADELSVALNGEWAPLLYVATQCWHREVSSQGDLTFLVPYTSCGVNFRDGRFILDLRSKDKMIPLSCPYDSISGLSLTNQPLPQREPSVYHKSPTGFPTKAIAGQIVKEEHGFLVEQLARNAARTPAVHPRSHLLPKLPSLPGSFNLAVNFPFSLPIPSRPAHRDQTSKPVDLTPAPTPAPTPDPTVSSSEFTDSVQSQLPHYVSEQIHQELAAPVTKAPKSEHHYMQYPYTFQKPVSAFSQTEPSLAQEYQPPRMPVPSAALYQPYGMTQNFPKPNPLHVNPAFASLAPYIPPGYYLCPYYNQHPPVLPQMFQPPVPTQPLLYQKPSYQKPEITPLAPTDPAVPPMKEYSEQQLASAVASSPHDSGSQRFQPTQYQPYLYQSSHGRPSSTTPLSPTSQLIPIYLQSQTRQYPPYPAFQDARPAQPQYYQMLNQPSGSVQQPWTTSRLPVKSLPQESRPLTLASSQTPEHLQYQTGGDQALDLYQRSGTGISSPSQYQLSEFPKFPYPALRPEVLSGYVSTENSGSKGFFQPRSKAPVPIPEAPAFTGTRPIISSPPPEHQPLQGKSEAQVAQLPYSQGPLVGYIQNPHVNRQRPSEPRSQKPQNDTLPHYQFFRQANLPKDVYVPPHFRSTSQEEVQSAKKASHSGS